MAVDDNKATLTALWVKVNKKSDLNLHMMDL